MSARRFVLASLLVLAACRPEDDPELQSRGRATLERTGAGARRLAELPVTAMWCDRDTVLSLVGADPTWALAIAVRFPWPAESALALPVDTVHGAGKAAVAARPIADSVGTARIGRSGTVTIEPGEPLTGRFEFTSGADSTEASFAGRFADLAVTRVCP